MKIYIAGPMRGIPYWNFPAFDRAKSDLTNRGYETISPVDMDRDIGFDAMTKPPDTDWSAVPKGFNMDACLVRDINAIRRVDAIYLLTGWEDSTGCAMEKAIAEFLGLKILIAGQPGDPLFSPWDPFLRLVGGDAPEDLPKGMSSNRPGSLSQAGPLPEDSAERKTYPLYRGLFKYFPRALAAVAHHSFVNNEKHNPGEPIHWSREKSADHSDCLLRHVMAEDWVPVAWRALAQLEMELEKQAGALA